MWQGALADCAECGTFGCNISYAIKEIMKMCASVCLCVFVGRAQAARLQHV